MTLTDKFGRDRSAEANLRSALLKKSMRSFHIDHQPQRELASCLHYMMQCAEHDSDDIRPGMLCFANEGAGKTYAVTQFVNGVNRKWSSDMRAVYFSFKTAKGAGPFLYKLIDQIGSDRWKPKPTERRDRLESMLFDIFKAKNTQLLAIDELGNANFKVGENTDFTNLLKTILNDRIASIALFGVPESIKVISHSRELLRRLKTKCELPPLTTAAGDLVFIEGAMRALDRELQRIGAASQPSCLTSTEVTIRLVAASGGGLGYMIDIVKLASESAVRRGRPCIELGDLALATDEWLVSQGLIKSNPFAN